MIGPLCPLAQCQQARASQTSYVSAGDPFEGIKVTPCVVLNSLLALIRTEEHEPSHVVRLGEKSDSKEKSPLDHASPSHPSELDLAYNVLKELECQVCFNIMVQPTTTRCAHTFCRQCLARSLDHSEYCPLCRAQLPTFHHFVQQKPNAALVQLLDLAFPSLVCRTMQQQKEDAATTTMPIFVCALAFPNIPTFLHIFEPRYRLMIRRAWEHDKRFGMCLPGEHGGIHPYGTVLEIRKYELLPDGRSLIETVGVGRFKMGTTDVVDGYTVAQVEPVVDVSAEEEASLEQQALASLSVRRAELRERLLSASGELPEDLIPELSTSQLVAKCHEFIAVMRSGAAPWLRQKLNDTLGPVPEDEADLSFYMAALLPIYEHEKARLLPVNSMSFMCISFFHLTDFGADDKQT